MRPLLLTAVALLIGMHLCHRLTDWPLFGASAFDITVNYSLAEIFTFLELFWIIVLFVRLSRHSDVLAWAVLFGVLLLDDLLKVHEVAGEWVVSLLRDDPDRYLVNGMRTQDLGEIAVLAAIVLPVVAILIRNHVRGAETSRRIDRKLTLLLVPYATFAIGLDLIAEFFTGRTTKFVLTLIEDGGELVMLSLIAAYVTSLYYGQQRPSTGD